MPRKAGCTECEEIIDATHTVCPNCGADAAADHRGLSEKFRNRGVAMGLGIPIVAWFLFSGLPSILTWILWIPAVVIGGTSGVWYWKRMSTNKKRIQNQNISQFSVGQKKNESYNYRKEKKEQRKKEKKRKRERDRERRTVVDMNCPICGHDWEVREGVAADIHHGHGVSIIGSEQYGKVEVQCDDCDHTRRLQVE
jgi:predicted RNA-binding Zn-ribbon protein involved in translation (DUF1610 family)